MSRSAIISASNQFARTVMAGVLAATIAADALAASDAGWPPATAAVAERENTIWQTAAAAYINPAVRQWQFGTSLTTVGAGYDRRADHGTVDPRNGSSEYDIHAGADTYTKYKSSTLWGHARYTSGRTDNAVWCETSDAALLYPYLSADSIGGDFKREIYSFAGGYADHNGRWSWGVQLGYTAKLEYREVDPRPRNVCGTLDASAGAGYRLMAHHWLSLGLELQKYKQNNDIMFKSEMGSDKIYHLTGPAESYQRFDGAADAARYDGYRYGVSLSLVPDDRQGAFALVRLSRFTFDCILTDLNKLPMASLWDNSLLLRAGWMHTYGNYEVAAYGQLAASRRHGTENLFGDPSSNVYPQIGSIEMFGRNLTAVSGGLSLGWHASSSDLLLLTADVAYTRQVTAYREPWQYSRIKGIGSSAALRYNKIFDRGLLLSVSAGMTAVSPFGCDYTPGAVDAELAGLERINRHVYGLESSGQLKINACAGVTVPLWSRYAMRLEAAWLQHRYHDSISSDLISTSLTFIF